MTGSARRAKKSIARRTTTVVLVSSLVASLGASLLAAAALDVLMARHADRRLLAALDTLIIELDEEREGEDKDSLDEILEDENQEIATSGIRLAVYEGEERLAGAEEPFVVALETCGTRLSLQPIRSCAKAYGRWILVSAQVDDRVLWRKYLGAAVVLALLLGGVLSYFLSRRLGAWAVEPLTRLSFELSRVDLERSAENGALTPSDLEEVHAVKQAMDSLLGRVTGLLNASRRFSRDAAHELLTPLAATSAELELLQEREREVSSNPLALSASISRLHRLSQLVESLLVLAADPTTIRATFEPVSLDECISEVVDELPAGDAARVEWKRDREGLVLGEPVLCKSVVGNALSNALKFTTNPVQVTLDEVDGEVVIRVIDDGPGIPTELRAAVMDPFVRGSDKSTPGHGIGLSLVAHIMNAHDGSVAFEDQGRGTCLRLTFPSWTSPDGDV